MGECDEGKHPAATRDWFDEYEGVQRRGLHRLFSLSTQVVQLRSAAASSSMEPDNHLHQSPLHPSCAHRVPSVRPLVVGNSTSTSSSQRWQCHVRTLSAKKAILTTLPSSAPIILNPRSTKNPRTGADAPPHTSLCPACFVVSRSLVRCSGSQMRSYSVANLPVRCRRRVLV